MRNGVDLKLELLRMEGLGFNRNEIVKAASVKFQVTPRTIYYHLTHQSEWQPKIQDTKSAFLDCLNRYQTQYRE